RLGHGRAPSSVMAEDRPRQTESSLLRGGLAGRSCCVLAARRCHARCPKRWLGALTVKQALRLYDARRRTPRTPTLSMAIDTQVGTRVGWGGVVQVNLPVH